MRQPGGAGGLVSREPLRVAACSSRRRSSRCRRQRSTTQPDSFRPRDQPSPGPKLQTNDDRFLNAVETSGGAIWTADGTTCFPPGDSVQRACLDYLELNSTTSGHHSPGFMQQMNNVGVDGADLYYPAVAMDSGGNIMTVFDESSTIDGSIHHGCLHPAGWHDAEQLPDSAHQFHLLRRQRSVLRRLRQRRVPLGRLLRCGRRSG